ncbi:MAG: hypothetical protein EBZ49_18345, partial [Proteobacteria bacterium]|nr:hypothetical protein [Pseudomonadota bacterium]
IKWLCIFALRRHHLGLKGLFIGIQQLMANILNRKIITANGAENVQDWGKHCRNGWCITEPEKSLSSDVIHRLDQVLPELKLQWDVHGNPLK